MTSLAVEGSLPVGLLAGDLVPGGVWDSVTYPLGPSYLSVKAGRDHSARALREWGLAHMCDDLGVVVSELVTNALRHGLALDTTDVPRAPHWLPSSLHPDWPIELWLLRTESNLLCAVNDPSSAEPVRVPRDSTVGRRETGRGLRLVQSLSLAWGWAAMVREGIPSGKTVWALFGLSRTGIERTGIEEVPAS